MTESPSLGSGCSGIHSEFRDIPTPHRNPLKCFIRKAAILIDNKIIIHLELEISGCTVV